MSAEAADWHHGQYEALWSDPSPRTAEGQRLWRLFRDGKLGPSPSGIRDFGQRINQIEAEASAEAGTLDEAWAAAEAALPEGWELLGVERGLRHTDKFYARAWPVVDPLAVSLPVGISESGPTPTAALHALAAALRGVPA